MKTDIMLFHENGKVYYYDMETNKIDIWYNSICSRKWRIL